MKTLLLSTAAAGLLLLPMRAEEEAAAPTSEPRAESSDAAPQPEPAREARPAESRHAIPTDARQLLGKTVYDLEGNKLGKVQDVVIDFNSGRLAYLLVESGGWFRRDTIKPVPAGAFTLEEQASRRVSVFSGPNPGIRRIQHSGLVRAVYVMHDDRISEPPRLESTPRVAVQTYQNRFEAAPSLAPNPLAELSRPQTIDRLSAYYGVEPMLAPGTAVAVTPQGETLTPTGRTEPAEARLNSARNFIGREVYNLQGERIGVLEDFVLNLDGGGSSFAVLSAFNYLYPQEQRYLVSPQALTRSPEPGRLLLNVSWSTLQKAETWHSGRTPSRGMEIYRY